MFHATSLARPTGFNAPPRSRYAPTPRTAHLLHATRRRRGSQPRKSAAKPVVFHRRQTLN